MILTTLYGLQQLMGSGMDEAPVRKLNFTFRHANEKTAPLKEMASSTLQRVLDMIPLM